MLKKQLFNAALLIVIVCSLFACRKGEVCRTCTARYGTTVTTVSACSYQAEEDFKTQHYYAEVSCK